MDEKILGVLGGMGPLATAYFLKITVEKTVAQTDQEHIPMVVYNHTSIPDRTAFILDNNKENPIPILTQDAKKLEANGVCAIAMPCNTAHFFFEEIQKAVTVPVLHIVDETVKHIVTRDKTAKKIGILATSGTLYSGVYQDFCTRHGVQAVIPTKEVEDMLMDIIYNKIKTGQKVTLKEFLSVIDYMRELGCDYVVLGCTELSVIKNDLNLTRSDVVDSLEVLAKRSIEICGKQAKD